MPRGDGGFVPQLFFALLLSVATLEARRVLTTEVYNGSFTFVSVRSFMQSQLDAEPKVHQDAGEIR